MQSTGCLPAGLADLPPGPELAAALDRIDLAAVPARDRLTVLEAWHRQDSHTRARFVRAMVAVGYADPDRPDSAAELPDPYLDWADEIRAALAWTRRAADGHADDAVALVVELPAVWAALERGQIDPPKAAVFLRHLVGLPAAQIAHLCALVLPRARRWTTSEISRRLRRLIMEIDPAHYERLFRRAHARRGVAACVTEDGTATITAHGLAPEDADAAVARIDRLAHQVRRAGHPGRLDQIRVDLFVGFLDGRLHTLTDAQIITALLHDAAGTDAPGQGQRRSPRARARQAGTARCTPTRAPAAQPPTEPAGTGVSRSEAQPAKAGAGSAGSGAGPAESGVESGDTVDLMSAAEAAARAEGERAEPQPVKGERVKAAAVGSPMRARRGVHLQIALSTLLGLDDRPATLPALGPIPASRARLLVAAQHRAPWRYALTGPDGRLLRAGALRTRPALADLDRTARAATDPGAPGLVDLLVDAELLGRLAAPASDLPGSWRPVLTEILAARGRALDDDPGARFPHTGLRRHVEFRDRHCTFVGCLTPARTADLDHTRDHCRGGPTTAADLGPACRHDHGLKHRGWTLTQPEPGIFVWRSPLGRVYRTRAEPLLPPLPPPLPVPPEDDHCCADDEADQSEDRPDPPLIVWRPPTPPEEPRPPPPPPATDLDEPPPF
ncbi:hypothetical protein GCM10010472_03500 [Pseudonocardia halophobica]|uniref:DUF222 domain-containing protein n=1 Tax=Pseudonocardia halophobica TaxID=29401 RepID=A0A9W6NUV6_9PSEU|nr:HNH endonuclease signature motif containing protein [Pseudonocardia halophobica]GLL10690.1 hypothetical protein GCM10017577_18300 [Pseudonocardia halophobica]